MSFHHINTVHRVQSLCTTTKKNVTPLNLICTINPRLPPQQNKKRQPSPTQSYSPTPSSPPPPSPPTAASPASSQTTHPSPRPAPPASHGLPYSYSSLCAAHDTPTSQRQFGSGHIQRTLRFRQRLPYVYKARGSGTNVESPRHTCCGHGRSRGRGLDLLGRQIAGGGFWRGCCLEGRRFLFALYSWGGRGCGWSALGGNAMAVVG